MNKVWLLFLIVLVSISTQSQNIMNKDSLLQVLQNAKEDTSKVNIYINLLNSYEGHEPSKALEYGQKAYNLSRKLNFYSGEIKAARRIAYVYIIQGSLDSTLYYYQSNLKLAQEKNDSLNIGIAFLNLGSTYRNMSEFNSALDYITKAIKILEKYGDNKMQVEMNTAMQTLYQALPNYEKALAYGEIAVKKARELMDKELLMAALSNLSMSYTELHRFDESEKGLVEAQKLAKELNNLNAESAILLNLAGLFYEQKDYSALKNYAQQALTINTQIGSKDGECTALRALAISFLHDKDYTTAKEYTLRALKIAEENNYKIEMGSNYKLLSSISFATQDVEKGQEYFDLSEAIIEEVFNEAYLQTAAEYEKKYEIEKKDTKIKLQQLKLQQKNTLNYILVVASIVLLLFTFLLYKNYTHKQLVQEHRINELEKEKQLTATEAVLKGEEQERIRLAKDLHDGLGGMLSGIKYSFQTMKQNLIMSPDNQQSFERSMDMLDSSIREMRRVAHNMMPESLVKFGLDTAIKDFCNEINTSGVLKINYQSIGMTGITVEQTTAITVYRVIQELINNIIKHASAQTAIVQLTYTNSILAVTVEDDGRGFKLEKLEHAKGMGWVNIKNRIDFLGGMVNIDSEPGKGTSVHIEISA